VIDQFHIGALEIEAGRLLKIEKGSKGGYNLGHLYYGILYGFDQLKVHIWGSTQKICTSPRKLIFVNIIEKNVYVQISNTWCNTHIYMFIIPRENWMHAKTNQCLGACHIICHLPCDHSMCHVLNILHA
jgi:hypothetical protein